MLNEEKIESGFREARFRNAYKIGGSLDLHDVQTIQIQMAFDKVRT
jgi:hypothetical protein